MRLIRMSDPEAGPKPEAKRFSKNNMDTVDLCICGVGNLSFLELRDFKEKFLLFYKNRKIEEGVKAIHEIHIGSSVRYTGAHASRRYHVGVFINNGDLGKVLKKNRVNCKVKFKDNNHNIWNVPYALLSLV